MTTETKHTPSEREIEAAAMALYGDGWEHKATVGNKKYCYEKAVEMLTAASQSLAPMNCATCGGDGVDHNSLNDPGPCRSCGGSGAEPSPSDQSERIAKLEAALAAARKVIEPFSDIAGEMFARNWNNGQVAIALDKPSEPHRVLFEHFVAARDWLTRNSEQSNG